ncbi:hypothetical protein ACTFIW_000272 [Dictyostelium discoideum]
MDNYKKKDFFYFKPSEEIEEEIIDCFVENPVDENMFNQQQQQLQNSHENLEINEYHQSLNEMEDMIFTYSNTNISNDPNLSENNVSDLIKMEINNSNNINYNINNNTNDTNTNYNNNNNNNNSNLKIKRRNSIILENVGTNIRIDTTNISSTKKRRIFN